MKMKRFFSNKNKKKRPDPSPVILEQKQNSKAYIQDDFDSLDSKALSRKQKRNQKKQIKKAKSKDLETATVLVNGNRNLITNDGTKVVLRRSSNSVLDNDVTPYSDRDVTRRKESAMRIPGSESSSRTASSASSSSSKMRRPWSWVEPSRGYTLGEFVKDGGDYLRAENANNVTYPHTNSYTLSRNFLMPPSAEQSDFANETFMSTTLEFFRRLRRPTMSHSQKHSLDLNYGAPENRGTFRKRDSNSKARKSKSQKSSKSNSPHNSLCEQNSSASLHSTFNSTAAGPASLSDLSVHSEDTSHKRSYSNSTTSTGTVISNSATPVRTPEELDQKIYNTCNSCNQTKFTCSCGDTILSIIDTDPSMISFNTTTSVYNNRYSSPAEISHTPIASTRSVASLRIGLRDDSSVTSGSTIEASYECDGSFSKIHKKHGPNITQTLPRKLPKTDVKNPPSTLKTRTFYTSSPQLCSPYKGNSSAVLATMEENSANSLIVPHRYNTTRERSQTVAYISHLREPQLVDSPIKRAIAFPGVVLRRHQNKSEKKKNQSTEMLSREDRAFQTMSLNFDNPVRKTALLDFRKSQNLATLSDHINRLHSTSAGDLRDFSCLQDLDPDTLLDDDELSNFYLAYQPKKASSTDSNRSFQNQEQSSKRVKNLRKSVATFANLISPGKPRGKLQRSSSFKEPSAAAPCKPYRPPGTYVQQNSSGSTVSSSSLGTGGSTPGRRSNSGNAKNRRSKLWCETFDHTGLNDKEVKRQEAIYELYQGENDLVQDLKMAKQTYRDSMVTLKMLTEDEVVTIFGKLDCLLPLHEDLLQHLDAARSASGKTENIGKVFINWFPALVSYEEYCANQASAKEVLDKVISREARVRDFLQRCLASPFSRKLDLWSYLDLPRSRLVKYPLLLKNILKATAEGHPDKDNIEQALGIINDIISRVDDVTGEQQASFVLDKFEFLDDKQRCPELDDCRSLLCSGQLKSNRGLKLQVFLFDLVIVLTRNATRGGKFIYQVYRQPLLLRNLTIDSDEGGKSGGSFRGGILSSDKAKHSFRIRSEFLNIAYTLIASDEHDRKQWLNSIQEAVTKLRSNKDAIPAVPTRSTSEKAFSSVTKTSSVKRSSSVKSENGNMQSSPGPRSRSMTSNALNLSRRLSKEKKDSVSRKFKLSSPLARRRNTISTRKISAPIDIESLRSSEWDESSNDGSIILQDGTNDDGRKSSSCRRTQSLNASPNISQLSGSFLSRFYRSNSKRQSSLARSESCNKPPSGRVIRLANSYNLRSSIRTPPKSPRLIQPTRSAPNLYLAKNNYSVSTTDLTLDTLDEVKQRLSLSSDTYSDASSKLEDSPPPTKDAHWIHDSANVPASSFTSQFFPMVEEEEPACKLHPHPLHTSQSNPLIVPPYPKIGAIMSNWSSTPKIYVSFKQADDEPISPKEDSGEFETTLVNVSGNSVLSAGDSTPVNCDVGEFSFGAHIDEEEVASTVDFILDSVSNVGERSGIDTDAVTDVTDDAGLLWLGDVMEASA